jgi:hypothetical protein
MPVATELNTPLMSRQMLDAGCPRETNLYLLDKIALDGYVVVDKDKHTRHEPAPRGRIPKAGGLRERDAVEDADQHGSPSLRSRQACRGTGLCLSSNRRSASVSFAPRG